MTAVIERDAGTRSDRRRTRRRRRAWGLVVVLLLGGGAYGFVALRPRAHKRAPVATAARAQHTLLLSMSLHDDPSARADSLTLFASDADGSHPVVLFIPARTLGQIPGQDGFGPIGEAASLGDPVVLPSLTIENVTGVRVDDARSFDEVTIGRLIQALGGIDVEVTEQIYEPTGAGTSEQVFPLGKQHMDGAAAVDYLTYRSDTETELRRFVRAQKVWDAILSAGPTALARAAAAASDEPLEQRQLAAFATALQPLAGPAGTRRFDVLPVKSIDAGGKDEAYDVQPQGLDELVAREFPGARTGDVAPGARPKIELRNGVGAPGLGQKAAQLLVPAGMKIEVAGNARSFTFPETRIVVYSREQGALDLARKIRQLLGVGKIEIGTAGQSVVTATIVLGIDFARR